MVLSIDFGGAIAKVLIVEKNSFRVVEVPLGFRTRPHLKVPEMFRYVLKQAVGDKKPEAVYASGEIASVELKEILSQPPLDPVDALRKFGLPVVSVGAHIAFVEGEAMRGMEIGELAEDIRQFVPLEIRTSEIQNYFANKEFYPQIIPTTPRDHYLEQAAARVRIKLATSNQQPATSNDYIIATGGVFSKAPEPGQVILMLLDALQPSGLFRIFLDQKQMLPALATLACYQEEKAQEILDRDPFVLWGTTFSLPGDVSLRIDLDYTEPQELTVAAGEIVLFPLEAGQTARVQFETQDQRGEFEAEGGVCGLVVDTRGRPLELPPGEGERLRTLKEWEEEICLHPLFKK